MSGSVIKTFADERLLASNLGISFLPSCRFGVAVKGNSIHVPDISNAHVIPRTVRVKRFLVKKYDIHLRVCRD